MENKSTLKEIEERFDNDVERFSSLDTGQATTLDAAFNMELITDAIRKVYPELTDVLDIGCGAGNYPVKLLQKIPNLNVTLVDLSQPMLAKAKERVENLTSGNVTVIKGDFRTVDFNGKKFEVIMATAVLHHLRDDADWFTSFERLYELLVPGGSIWIFDLILQNNPALQHLIYNERYGDYLVSLRDGHYRDHVSAYIEKEDSPRSLMFQLDLLKQVGFTTVDVLHKNLCFSSYVAFK